MSAQLPVLDSRIAKSNDGNWFVSRDVLERHRGNTGPVSFFDRMLWAVAEAMFSTDAGPPPSERLSWLCADLKDFLVRSGPRTRWIFTLALFFTSWIAPIFVGRFPPLARLSVRDRAAALEHFEHGNVLQSAAILAVKTTLCILYFEHPDAAHEIGFDGQCKGAS